MSMLKNSVKFLRRHLVRRKQSKSATTEPLSKLFGADRGTPIDRYYIKKFLKAQKPHITGKVLEIAESTYTRLYGINVTSFEVLHFSKGNPNATMVGDLTDAENLPDSVIDCFICTQTLHMIYDFKAAIRGTYKVLKPGGILLATLPGITQISRYDMDRWGDYWRFTSLSALMSFEDVYGEGNVTVDYFGNCLAATSFLQGVAEEEMSKDDLDTRDKDYQVVITVTARKEPALTNNNIPNL